MPNEAPERDDYVVSTFELGDEDFVGFRNEVDPRAQLRHVPAGGGPTWGYYAFHVVAISLLPIAGAIGKTVLDLIEDRVKNWLARRPEDRTVEIFGPDDTVISVVKVGNSVSTTRGRKELPLIYRR
jgi:hypothetical protein